MVNSDLLDYYKVKLSLLASFVVNLLNTYRTETMIGITACFLVYLAGSFVEEISLSTRGLEEVYPTRSFITV